jgi:hypothetical protein
MESIYKGERLQLKWRKARGLLETRMFMEVNINNQLKSLSYTQFFASRVSEVLYT